MVQIKRDNIEAKFKTENLTQKMLRCQFYHDVMRIKENRPPGIKNIKAPDVFQSAAGEAMNLGDDEDNDAPIPKELLEALFDPSYGDFDFVQEVLDLVQNDANKVVPHI